MTALRNNSATSASDMVDFGIIKRNSDPGNGLRRHSCMVGTNGHNSLVDANARSVKSSNFDNFEGIHYYLYSSRFWPTVVKRATNNQAYQSFINTACA
jgi:hypothetical protein